MRIISLAGVALDFLCPPSCASCSAELERNQSLFCHSCRLQTEAPQLFRETLPTRAAFGYCGSAKQAVLQLKFHNRPQLAAAMAEPMWRAAGRLLAARTLVPVPTSPLRLAERGYNAPALLAQSIAARSGLALASRCLLKREGGVHQAALSQAERFANVKNSIGVRHKVRCPVLLIDDVRTSGATLQACALALNQAGIKVEGVLTFAQTPLPGSLEPTPNPASTPSAKPDIGTESGAIS